MTREEPESIKLTIKSLLEVVVQTGAKNIEISVMESYGKVTVCCTIVLSLRTLLTCLKNLELFEIETIVT